MKVQKILSLVSLSFVLLSHVEAGIDAAYLSSQKIILKSENIDPRYIADFMREFRKFPAALHQEMVNRGGKIHLIQGDGVTDDPTWRGEISTENGRGWNSVPGSGGAPYAGVPTRIVVNQLERGPDTHGASNLFLHEHAHSLDSTYRNFGISSSEVWKNLMRDNPEVSSFLHVCGQYCNGSEEERFAELFSLYYDSRSSRNEMVQQIPRVAEFFANLTSARNPGRSNSRGQSQEQRQEPRQEERQQRRPAPRQETRQTQQPRQEQRQEERQEGRRLSPEQQEEINEATEGLPWFVRWAARQLSRLPEGDYEFSLHSDLSSDDEGIYLNQTSSDERFDTGYSEYDRQGNLRSGNGIRNPENNSEGSNGSRLEKPPGASRGPKPPRDNYESGSRDNYGSGTRDNYGSGKPPAPNNRHDHEALNDNNSSRSIKPPQGSGKPPKPPQSSQAPRPGKPQTGPSGKLPSTSSKPK